MKSEQRAAQVAHTPGPWTANRHDPDSPWTVVSTSGRWVCKVSSDRNWAQQSPAEEFANARLIEAAPDLLAACKAACATVDKLREIVGDAGDAIPLPAWYTLAKATIASAEGGGK